MKERFEILNEALRIRSEIKQMFVDCEHWNNHVRKPSVDIIDPDPDGQMTRLLAGIEKGLEKELLCCHVEGPDEIEACISLGEADKRASDLNALFDLREKTEHTPEMRAVVKAWPFSVESHTYELSHRDIINPKATNGHGE